MVVTEISIESTEQIVKFVIMFLVGGLFVGVPKYLNTLPKNEDVMRRYLWASFLMHGGLGIMAGTALIFIPTNNLLILGGLSAAFSFFGADFIQKIAIIYTANKFGVKLNGNGKNGKSVKNVKNGKNDDNGENTIE